MSRRFQIRETPLPGVVLICLSLLVFLVSLSALLLLTVPLYRFLTAICGVKPGVVMPAGTSGLPPSLAVPDFPAHLKLWLIVELFLATSSWPWRTAKAWGTKAQSGWSITTLGTLIALRFEAVIVQKESARPVYSEHSFFR